MVDSAANLKKFYILKGEKDMEKFAELIKNFMADSEIELKEEDIEKVKGLSPEKAKELSGAIEMLNEYKKDGWPSELIEAVTTLTKSSTYDYPEKEPGEKEFDVKEFIEKAGQRLSKATIEQLKKALTIIQGLIGEREKSVKKQFKDAPPELVEELTQLRLEKQQQEEREKEEKEKKEKKEKEDLIKRVENLEKGDKTGIEGQDNTDNGGGENEKDVKKKKEELLPTMNRVLFPGYYKGRK